MDASKNKVLRIRMKNNTSSKLAELFFTTSTDAALNAAKSIKITIEPNNDDFVEYEVEIENELWKGNITQIRFDPITAVGDLEIDYIRFSQE